MYRPIEAELMVSLRPKPKGPSIAALIPIMAVVLIAFLMIGLALPVLPLHLHQGLGFGAFIVGLVTGSQFGASLLSRVWAGHFAGRRGPKRAVLIGLLTAVAAGFLYILSLRFVGLPAISVAILLLGRALLGGAESFIITGAISWGLALVGASNAGRVIAWIGMAMFAALALGAPLGTALYSAGGFAGVAIATTLTPLPTMLLIAPLPPVPPQSRGLAMGAHTVFLDAALGFGSPALGLVAGRFGLGAAFLISALIALTAAAVALHLLLTPSFERTEPCLMSS